MKSETEKLTSKSGYREQYKCHIPANRRTRISRVRRRPYHKQKSVSAYI